MSTALTGSSLAQPPTPAHHQLPAMREYVAGECLCDAGRIEEGMAKLRHASKLAWELDGEPDAWPDWAHGLYETLAHAAATPGCAIGGPPPLIGPPEDNAAFSALRRASAVGQWWRRSPAFTQIATVLQQQNFVVLDGFLGAACAAELKAACEAAWHAGSMVPAEVCPAAVVGNSLRSLILTPRPREWQPKAADALENHARQIAQNTIVVAVETM